MIRLRGLRVTLHMRSGRRFTYLCDNVEKTYKGNELIGLSNTDTKDWPFYVRLDEIEAITNRKVFWLRWRW